MPTVLNIPQTFSKILLNNSCLPSCVSWYCSPRDSLYWLKSLIQWCPQPYASYTRFIPLAGANLERVLGLDAPGQARPIRHAQWLQLSYAILGVTLHLCGLDWKVEDEHGIDSVGEALGPAMTHGLVVTNYISHVSHKKCWKYGTVIQKLYGTATE